MPEGNDPTRRQLLKGLATLFAGSALAMNGPFRAESIEGFQRKANIRALVFDAYGTLFDVNSVVARCEQMFPGKGQMFSNMWRAKQLEYSWLLSLMDRYADFWQVTERALTYSCKALSLPCTSTQHMELMDEYR